MAPPSHNVETEKPDIEHTLQGEDFAFQDLIGAAVMPSFVFLNTSVALLF